MTDFIRERLKSYSVAEIAKAAGMPIDQVASILDNPAGELPDDVKAKLTLAAGKLDGRHMGNAVNEGDDCQCPICQLRKSGKFPGIVGATVIEFKRDQPQNDTADKRTFGLAIMANTVGLTALGLALVTLGMSVHLVTALLVALGAVAMALVLYPTGKEGRG